MTGIDHDDMFGGPIGLQRAGLRVKIVSFVIDKDEPLDYLTAIFSVIVARIGKEEGLSVDGLKAGCHYACRQ